MGGLLWSVPSGERRSPIYLPLHNNRQNAVLKVSCARLVGGDSGLRMCGSIKGCHGERNVGIPMRLASLKPPLEFGVALS